MSSITTFPEGSTVLVSGANGHVSQHVVQQLLNVPSIKVRATVRSASSGAGLVQIFRQKIESGSLDIVHISDITKDGAFNDAIKDCTHVAHVASPLVVGSNNVEEDVLKPALRGTLSLLASAENASNLKSIVITGSFASVIDPMQDLRPGYTYTPADWNPLTYEMAADPALNLQRWPERYRHFVTYMTSKKVAERDAWDWYAQHKPKWDLCFVNPTYIVGPYILPTSREKMSYSCQLICNVALSKPNDSLPVVDFPNWVDVRDVARAQLLALAKSQARGERFILAPNKVPYSAIAKIARDRLNLHASEEIQELPSMYDVESRNCDSILGMTPWIPFEDSVVDLVKQVMSSQGVKLE